MSHPNEIPLSEAIDLTQRFKQNQTERTKRAFLIPRDALTELLDQDYVENIRIYLGEKENRELTIVAVATDNEGTDFTNLTMDGFESCPSNCDYDSPL